MLMGASVSRFLQTTLSRTSRLIDPGGGRFWTERPRVLPVYSDRVMRVKTGYIHQNPVRRGLVELPEEWPHSSFRQLCLDDHSGPFLCDDWRCIAG